MNKYDVICIGSGPMGIATALNLIKHKPDIKILIIDKGKDIDQRGRTGLDLTTGFLGAGCWSDGKTIYSASNSTQYGGRLCEYVGSVDKFMSLMSQVDETLMGFSDDKDVPLYGEDAVNISRIKLEAARNGMNLLQARIRHFGSDGNEKVARNIRKYLDDKIEFKFETTVVDFEKIGNEFSVKYKNKDGSTEESECKYLVLGPGRSGNKWLENVAKNKGLTVINRTVDIGIRVETAAMYTDHIDSILYEPKLICRTDSGSVRSFCWNRNGYTVHEKIKDEDGVREISTANGYSNSKGSKTENTNFALLCSTTFSEPLNQASTYGYSVARLCNELAGGGILVQRLKDLRAGVRSTASRMRQINIDPTLKTAIPGDISFGIPGRQLNAILEAFNRLDKLMPGVAGDDTILLAPEIKFYSAGLELTEDLQTEIENMYAGGDGASVSRGISQAFGSGIIIAEAIIKKIN